MKLSIITINYNNKDGLQKTIDSVICQTWTDYEWIVIDGGSTDGSKELIEQYQDHFAYWCSEPDKGVYNAMNKGVFHAHGEYVNFMNSGDVFHSSHVLASIFAKKLSADILIGQVKCMGENLIVNQFNHNLAGVNWKRVNEGFCHQGTFSKIGLLKAHPFDEKMKIASDWKFWCQTIVFDNCSVQNLELIVADYDMTGISSKVQNSSLQSEEREQTMRSLFPPLIIKELQDYQSLRNSPCVYNLDYLDRNNHGVFVVLRKVISFIYKVLSKN